MVINIDNDMIDELVRSVINQMIEELVRSDKKLLDKIRDSITEAVFGENVSDLGAAVADAISTHLKGSK